MSDKGQVPRRSVVKAAGVGWLALCGSLAAGTWAVGRFIRPNAANAQNSELTVGPVDRYASLPSGQVSEVAGVPGIWITRINNRIVAFEGTCTHLGCRVSWARDDERFRCPCHGSSFAADGTNLDGPAPRALERLAIRVQDGQLVIDRSRRFRKERGEWERSDSYVQV